ncbi:unnamed protein product [Moneuplotes crassus]|uniref:Histidine kinase domain-containing protein n=1 Tax=Euplotes crassus TaxID=5936 RepID=A0AAD1YBN0_EUPCR|nr:unnamed protein product [Moneuplotes crassus]
MIKTEIRNSRNFDSFENEKRSFDIKFIPEHDQEDSQNRAKQLMICLIKAIFQPVIDIYYSTKDFIKDFNKGDEDIKDLLEEHSKKSISSGWDALVNLNRVANAFISLFVFCFSNDTALRKRCFIIVSLFMAIYSILNFLGRKMPELKKYFFACLLLVWGNGCISGTLKTENYHFYEMWIVYMSVVFLCNAFICLHWKFLVIPNAVNMITLILRVHWKYNSQVEDTSKPKTSGVPLMFYVATLLSILFVSIGPLLHSIIFRKMLHLIKENRDLTDTIQNIFQMFPEGVIIQQLGTHNKFVTKYVKKTARECILHVDSTGTQIDVKDSPVRVRQSNKKSRSPSCSLSSLSELQCHKLDKIKNTKKAINSMVSLFKKSRIKADLRGKPRLGQCGLNDHDEYEDCEEPKYYTVKTMNVLWNHNTHSYMHIFVDSTHVKKLEEEQAKSSCQKVMFASVSHEFRTPLNAFENSLSLIKFHYDQVLSEVRPFLDQQTCLEVDSYSAQIQKFIKMGTISSRLLMNLVEDILDLEKFDSGVFMLNIASFKLGDLAKDICYIFEEQCHKRGLYFRIIPEFDALLEHYFVSDQSRIRQVLINLISNAVKFTHTGGIKVILELRESNIGTQLWFSVRDTGVRINKKKANLFQMFSMVKAHRKEINQHGTGIGLYISKRIVESLGGQIDYESKEFRGSTFSFYITLKPPSVCPSPSADHLPTHFFDEHFEDFRPCSSPQKHNKSKFLF